MFDCPYEQRRLRMFVRTDRCGCDEVDEDSGVLPLKYNRRSPTIPFSRSMAVSLFSEEGNCKFPFSAQRLPDETRKDAGFVFWKFSLACVETWTKSFDFQPCLEFYSWGLFQFSLPRPSHLSTTGHILTANGLITTDELDLLIQRSGLLSR